MTKNCIEKTGESGRSSRPDSPMIEIDSNSGFCFGVVTAIQKAEDELKRGEPLACLGDIVHNASEVERLRQAGLRTITHDDLKDIVGGSVLLRAHGEPPSTYISLKSSGTRIIDATCPVVLRLQKRINKAYSTALAEYEAGERSDMPLILIYGKKGHAEVNGLVGQTDGHAIVIENANALDSLNLDKDILLYSQTTKSLEGFREIVEFIKGRKVKGRFDWFDTICRQVATRSEKIKEFASTHDTVIFVTGAKSSNGKVLLQESRRINDQTYAVTDATDLKEEWFKNSKKIGICGATSTPGWLMEDVANRIKKMLNNRETST